jgi:hypothetical protein
VTTLMMSQNASPGSCAWKRAACSADQPEPHSSLNGPTSVSSGTIRTARKATSNRPEMRIRPAVGRRRFGRGTARKGRRICPQAIAFSLRTRLHRWRSCRDFVTPG